MTSTDRSPTPVPTAARRRPHPARRARRVVAALSAGSFLVLTGCFAVDGGSSTGTATTSPTGSAADTTATDATTATTAPSSTSTRDHGWGSSTAAPGSGRGPTSTQSSGS